MSAVDERHVDGGELVSEAEDRGFFLPTHIAIDVSNRIDILGLHATEGAADGVVEETLGLIDHLGR